jgi:hypothetical protein
MSDQLFDAQGRPVIVPALQEFTHRLVGGQTLAVDGVQWSAEVVTVTADTDYTGFSLTLDHGLSGDLALLTFALTLAIKAGSATADPKYKWQARNKGGTWADLMADYITKTNVNTTYVEETVSGYLMAFPTTLNVYPIDLRLLFQSNESTPGVSTVKVKNSSYVTLVLK